MNTGQGLRFGETCDASTLIKLGVAVIPYDHRGWILLEKRADCGRWGLLGGRVDAGESVRDAIHREVREESGLEIEIAELVGVYSNPHDRTVVYLDKGDKKQLVDICVSAKIIGGELRCSEESECLAFYNPATIHGIDLIPPSIKPLNDFLAGVKGKVD